MSDERNWPVGTHDPTRPRPQKLSAALTRLRQLHSAERRLAEAGNPNHWPEQTNREWKRAERYREALEHVTIAVSRIHAIEIAREALAEGAAPEADIKKASLDRGEGAAPEASE